MRFAQTDGLVLMLRRSSRGCCAGSGHPEPGVLQMWSPEEAAKMCNKGRLFLNCFEERGGEGGRNYTLIIHLSLPVSCARFSLIG